MAHSIKQTVRGFILIGMGVVLGMAATADADQQVEPSTPDQTEKIHKIKYPRVIPTIANGGCSDEVQAYLDAVESLSTARQDADDAYYEWMSCENFARPTPTATEQLAAAPKSSVLVTD